MKGAAEGHAVYDVLPDTTLAGGAHTASSMTNANVKAVSAGGKGPRVNSTMTNANVASATAKGDVKLLTLTYNGGEQHILVPPTAPVVAFVRPGFELLLAANEVQGSFEVPLSYVFEPANHRTRLRRLADGAAEIELCDIPFGKHNIWGATAGMLITLYRLCTDGAPP